MHPEINLPEIIRNLPIQSYENTCFRLVDFSILTGYNPMIPLYTLGPGKAGQRYTPLDGPNALYVAEDVVTANAEYHRVERIVLATDPNYNMVGNPTVQLTIQVKLERILDITNPSIQNALGTTVGELTGPWRKQMIKKTFCPTQVLSTAVYENGSIQALRYPSARGNGFSNLIIWEDRLQLPSFVQVHDSTGTLSARIPPKRIYRKHSSNK